MKRCPECRRDYFDDSLVYCLDDGARLLEGSGAGEEKTAILTGDRAELATKILPDDNVASRERSESSTRRTIILGLIGLIVVTALGVGSYLYWGRPASGEQFHSIAVLPFVNESGDPEAEYLSDGMAETLMNGLSQIPNLQVKARSAVFRYKGSTADTRTIGKELNVQVVLTGRVVPREGDLVLYLELDDVETGSRIWGSRYNRKQTEIAALQSEIARDVSENLRLKLSGTDELRLMTSATENAEAYRLYLKGRFYWNKRTKEGMEKGIEYFLKAIETDPQYARAFAGLADSYNFLAAFGIAAVPPNEAMPKAKAAATRALELDDSMAEAHASLGFVKLYYDRDWTGAETEFRKAIQTNPDYAPGYQWYSHLLMALGRKDEAVAQAKRAVEIDPLSIPGFLNLGWQYQWARDADAAIDAMNRLLDMDPSYVQGHWNLGLALEQKGRYQEAVSAFQKAVELSGGAPVYVGSLGHALALAGRTAEAKQTLSALEKRAASEYVPPFWLAIGYIGLGDKQKALDFLDVAFVEHSGGVVWLAVDPRMDPLRQERRFQDLLKRIGLPHTQGD